MPYSIEFAESVKRQLKELPAQQRALVLETIEKQLLYEPFLETTHRKRLRPNPIAPWELRIGNIRVFYDVLLEEPEKTVQILAIGQKRGNILFISNQKIHL
jgi:mRNA-degrading endonuclease RelE of RelBE toxin-antitoxin system